MDEAVFSAAVMTKLPLADSVWRLLHYTMDDRWLEDLWTRTRGRCYENELKFSTLAHLMTDALLEHEGSGLQAFERAEEAGTLPVSITASYDKLGNLPVPLSEILLEEGTRRMNAVMPEAPAVDPLPDCWAEFEVFGADGKAIKHVKRLLKPLRGLQAGILGARASVGLNLRTGLAVAMVGHLDGEAGEAVAGGAGPTLLQPEFPPGGVECRGQLYHPLLHQHDVRPRRDEAGPRGPRRRRATDRAGVGLAGEGREG
jgi:hypothetical protein